MARGGKREGAGRPKGKPNAVTAGVRELAQQYGPQALATLAKIMNDDGSPEAARVAASKELLDRAYGKSQQSVDLSSKDGSMSPQGKSLDDFYADVPTEPEPQGVLENS